MLLRIISDHKKGVYILCPNGSKMKASKEALNKLLKNFKKPSSFKGKDGYWNDVVPDMENVAGETWAIVNDSFHLVIYNTKLFSNYSTGFLTTTEYSEKTGKSCPSIKRMCAEGRLVGAYRTSAGWMIPEDAPWPERKPRTTKNKKD